MPVNQKCHCILTLNWKKYMLFCQFTFSIIKVYESELFANILRSYAVMNLKIKYCLRNYLMIRHGACCISQEFSSSIYLLTLFIVSSDYPYSYFHFFNVTRKPKVVQHWHTMMKNKYYFISIWFVWWSLYDRCSKHYTWCIIDIFIHHISDDHSY